MSGSDRNPDSRDPAGSRRLERAPGERYAGRTTATPAPAVPDAPGVRARAAGAGSVRAFGAAVLVAAAGALALFGLGLLDLGPGLLAAAAAVGWAVALALLWGGAGTGAGGRPARMAVAGVLGAVAVVAGLLLVWAWGRAEGGVLDPLGYLDERFGPLALADVVVAAAAGALRAR